MQLNNLNKGKQSEHGAAVVPGARPAGAAAVAAV
jgi:hypothetical protein